MCGGMWVATTVTPEGIEITTRVKKQYKRGYLENEDIP